MPAQWRGPCRQSQAELEFPCLLDLPLGLAQGLPLKRDIADGEQLKWADVVYDADALAVRVRREMEAAFATIAPDISGVI